MSPSRKEGEAQIFPGATAASSEMPPERPVFVYLSDSTEMNRVRAPLPVGAEVEVRCLFSLRQLTRGEETAFRNVGPLPDGVAASPALVECTVMTPGQRIKLSPAVSQRDGVYVASVVVGRRGGWFYRFIGRGVFSGSTSRAFDVR
jgi:hypothetical protein